MHDTICILNKFSFLAKKRSEKYLEKDRKSQAHDEKHKNEKIKLKKKSKKVKKQEIYDSESDGTEVMVNRKMDLPEGVSLSDNDDKNELDLNDPHRALDINLECALPSSTLSFQQNIQEEQTRRNDTKPISSESHKRNKKKKKNKNDNINLVEVVDEACAVDGERKIFESSKIKDVEKPRKKKKGKV